MINYPDGRKRVVEKKATTLDKRKTKNQTANERAYNSLVRSNMGMRFESEISKTCDFYRTNIGDIYACIVNGNYLQCIPYNEETAKLIGTKEEYIV